MKKIELKSRKLLRKVFNCFSLTAVAFIFQACYGPGPDCDCDVRLTGTVTSKTTNLPIAGIRVEVDQYHYAVTDADGKFDFYAGCLWNDGNYVDVHFADQTINVKHDCKDEVKINAELDLVEIDETE